jgi:probable rRNA maturation factor
MASSFIGLDSAVVILHKRVPALSRASLERFLLRARRAAGIAGSADVLVTNSETMRRLNRQFRGKDRATDVLSFPELQIPNRLQGVRTGRTRVGEIAISADIAMQNAAQFGHSAAEEIKILALHGILHLAGFDHERDNGLMARKELQLRQALGLPITLIQRTETATGRSLHSGRRSPKSAPRKQP